MKLDKSVLERALKNKDIECIVFDTVDSTNNEAKRTLGKGYNNPVLMISESQTNGRGRLGRNFFSPESKGIYMSYMYKITGPICDSVAVTAAAAVAVARAIKETLGIDCGIKWVNDIYIKNKKVCGILTEAISGSDETASQYVIVGIGINVSTTHFPKELQDIAAAVGDVSTDRNILAASVINHLETLIEELPKRTFLEEYRKLSVVIGRSITYTKNGEKRSGIAMNVDNNGSLIVRNPDGTEEMLNTGEISVRLDK